MVRIAGAKSKPHYLQTYQNAEKVLQITSMVSIQEVCVQVAAAHLAESAASVMTSYEAHLVQSLGEASAANLNLGRAVYPCAAVVSAAKLPGHLIVASTRALLGAGESQMEQNGAHRWTPGKILTNFDY